MKLLIVAEAHTALSAERVKDIIRERNPRAILDEIGCDPRLETEMQAVARGEPIDDYIQLLHPLYRNDPLAFDRDETFIKEISRARPELIGALNYTEAGEDIFYSFFNNVSQLVKPTYLAVAGFYYFSGETHGIPGTLNMYVSGLKLASEEYRKIERVMEEKIVLTAPQLDEEDTLLCICGYAHAYALHREFPESELLSTYMLSDFLFNDANNLLELVKSQLRDEGRLKGKEIKRFKREAKTIRTNFMSSLEKVHSFEIGEITAEELEVALNEVWTS